MSSSSSSSSSSSLGPKALTSFHAILSHLTATFAAPLLPPSKPHSTALTSQIASLQVHPTLEAALHLLNADLPAAHFLVRHMQAKPAFEGMFLHGILHRIEGDYDNARMWYSDVAAGEGGEEDGCGGADGGGGGAGSLYGKVWEGGGKTFKDVGEGGSGGGEAGDFGAGGRREGELDAGQRFLNAVQAFKEGKGGRDEAEMGRLVGESRREIGAVVEWCVGRFGEGRWEDARSAWVKNSEEVQKMSDDMINGDKGFRKF
ncbi:uncharacterized protein L3040_006420 [Drepanopeziza brunnea f. sp. 'multigermtubi']|uniref:uncharacterized protein n=1 Tax=Drepanopeziza brunnea f. sp. 'multigermtubi' TaxID=698441 RepID=UPI002389D5F0|nr:hypothetical protein L3040_006420 [Drepanopeziza brunnea f. sp. 'multigermtubi']